jgi:HAD superfamily hydrolase (TIGR01490 family)
MSGPFAANGETGEKSAPSVAQAPRTEQLEQAHARQALALFDLDGTLTRGDTLFTWMAVLLGRARASAAFARAFGKLRTPDAMAADWRGRVKCAFLQHAAGIETRRAAEAGAQIRDTIKWRSPIVDALRAHASLGHRIVIVTGAPQIYLPALLAHLPVDAMLGADLEEENGRLTGRLAAPNPVRAAKRDRVQAWLEANGPFGERWGYGNAPHDLPMLTLVDHKIVV